MKDSKPVIAYVGLGWHVSGGTRIIFEHANRLAERGYTIYLISTDTSFDTSWFKFHKNIKFVSYYNTEEWINNINIIFATFNESLWLIVDLPERIKKGYFVQSDERHMYPAYSMELYMADNTYKFKGLNYYTEAKWIQEWLKNDYQISAGLVKNKINKENFYIDKSEKYSSKKKVILVEGNAHVFKKGIQDGAAALEDIDAEKWLLTSAKGELPSYTKVFDRIFQSPPQGDIRQIYSGADILLKPSHFEGSPLPHLEAMCCGTAVISTNCKGVDEYCTHMENSYIVDIQDVEAMHNAVELLLKDDELRNRLIDNGLKFAEEYLYDWDSEIDKLEDFINEINKKNQYLYFADMPTRKLLEANFLAHQSMKRLNKFSNSFPAKVYKKIRNTLK